MSVLSVIKSPSVEIGNPLHTNILSTSHPLILVKSNIRWNSQAETLDGILLRNRKSKE